MQAECMQAGTALILKQAHDALVTPYQRHTGKLVRHHDKSKMGFPVRRPGMHMAFVFQLKVTDRQAGADLVFDSTGYCHGTPPDETAILAGLPAITSAPPDI
jgi:hypothetical protein